MVRVAACSPPPACRPLACRPGCAPQPGRRLHGAGGHAVLCRHPAPVPYAQVPLCLAAVARLGGPRGEMPSTLFNLRFDDVLESRLLLGCAAKRAAHVGCVGYAPCAASFARYGAAAPCCMPAPRRLPPRTTCLPPDAHARSLMPRLLPSSPAHSCASASHPAPLCAPHPPPFAPLPPRVPPRCRLPSSPLQTFIMAPSTSGTWAPGPGPHTPLCWAP